MRRLTLRAEALTDLTATDLREVLGAAAPTTPVTACAEEATSRVDVCDSLLRPCITHTCTL